ncbi:hypothetical protein LQE88_08830 [Acidaminococcus sp. NSJ-142]|jgi:predicted ATP-dependent serine protease|uniref:hypothetical protein n=1 Tax=Acidaminococcus TaxID=904 RepID=UPI000CFA00FD|nr:MULTISPECIES: hypothetical protein [Acidaminococcus]MCD2436085.1 hypothetical protein [Acidaminococcus hominis]MCH4096062.1 hypothetical protein [Acidaminococcus provencensis]
MICKQCGLEYPDDLEACPGCQAPNEEVTARVLTETERDSFAGTTIEARVDDGETDETFKVYDQEDLRREEEKKARLARLKAAGLSILKTALVVVALFTLFGFLMPALFVFLVIGLAVCAGWWFMHRGF